MDATELCDVLLIVVLREEWETFLEVFPEVNPKAHRDQTVSGLELRTYHFTSGGYSCVAATMNAEEGLTKQQGQAPAGAATVVLLQKYTPQVVVNFGIAARLKRDDHELGDVIVATHVNAVTSDAAAVQDGPGTPTRLRQGKPSIECSRQIYRSVVRHAQEAEHWRRDARNRVEAIEGFKSSSAIAHEGLVATGDMLSKSDELLRWIADNNRYNAAYEMEAYAIAERAFLADKRLPLLILKGLSDDGDYKKSQLEGATRGRMRSAAALNAATLLREAIQEGLLGAPRISASSAAGGSPSADMSNGSSPPGAPPPLRDAFPYFSVADLKTPKTLRMLLDTSPQLGVRRLRAVVSETNSGANALLQEPTDVAELLAWLNLAVDSEFAKKAPFLARESPRLAKVCYDGMARPDGIPEHSLQVQNRLLIEHVVNKAATGSLSITPIITCLIENTGFHVALEEFKKGFQRRHKAVVDFDALPLSDLYIKNMEMYRHSNEFDLIFDYHLNAHPFFEHQLVHSAPQSEVERLIPALIPAVADECCYVVDKSGIKQPVVVPISANTIVLVTNETLFEKHQDAFIEYTSGNDTLCAPTNWEEFSKILDFFDSRPDLDTHGIVLQGKRAGDSLYFEWSTIASSHSNGGVYNKKHGWQTPHAEDVILDSENTIKGTVFYRNLTRFHPRDIMPWELDANGQLTRFARGNIAMALMWSDCLYKLDNTVKDFKIGYYPIPGDTSTVGGGICCVNIRAQRLQLARQFVDELLDEGTQARLAQHGWCSAFARVYETPAVRKLPYSAAVETSLRRGRYMIEAGLGSDRIRKYVGDCLEGIVKDARDVRAALHITAEQLKVGFP